MKNSADLSLAWRLARRDFRSVGPSFVILFLCLALGVAMITTVGAVLAAVDAGLQSEGRRLLGGDIELRLAQRPASMAERDLLQKSGLLSHAIEMRAITRRETGEEEKTALAEVKAVDELYPLYGGLKTDPDDVVDFSQRLDGVWSAYADAALADRLDLRIGDLFRLGEARLVLTGLIAREPDRVASIFSLGPRVLLSQDALQDSGLLRPGALAAHLYRLRFDSRVDIDAWLEDLKAAFPQAGWQIRTPDNAAPGVERFIERLSVFLTLSAMTALLIGGVGIANAVRTHLNTRLRSIAILKCLGAPPRVITHIYIIQLSIVIFAAILVGLCAGSVMAYLGSEVLSKAAPVQAVAGLYLHPLLAAAVAGLLVAVASAAWPLAAAREVKAANLFRFALMPPSARASLGLVMLTGGCFTGLVLWVFWVIPDWRFALWFVSGASMAFSCLWAASHVVIAVAQSCRRSLDIVPQAWPALRLALANLVRPGAPALGVFLSLGISLSALIAIAVIDENLSRLVTKHMPESAPAYFFTDIRSDQAADFETLLTQAEGVGKYEGAQTIRGRITAIADIDASYAKVTPETQWALRGDRVFTASATAPPGTDIAEGVWWPADYQGEPLISLDAGLAQGFGVGIGDYMTLNILGRDIRARIANLRWIDWAGLNLNFAVVLSPNVLDGAPINHIYAVYTAPENEHALWMMVVSHFDAVTPIRVRDALEAAMRLIAKVSLAAQLAAAATLFSGILVLIGAMAAVQSQSLRELAIFKVLGATRRQLQRAYLIEYGLLGIIAGGLAIVFGTAGGWGVVTQLMGGDWFISAEFPLLTAAACTFLTIMAGAAAIGWTYRHRACVYLRNE